MTEMTPNMRATLTEKHGYVPGDLMSMADAVINGIEARTGVRLPLIPEAPLPPDASDSTRASGRFRRTWKAEVNGWEFMVQTDGFSIGAFTEHFASEEKDARMMQGDIQPLIDLVSGALDRALPEPEGGPRGP